MRDRLVLLGTKGGPSIRKGSPSPSASVVQLSGKTIVVDCGIGVTRSLVEAGVRLDQIDYVFITHLHSDHLLELGPLLYTAWTSNLKTPVTVYGPPGIVAYWDHFIASMDLDHSIRTGDEKREKLTDLIRIETFTDGRVANLDGIEVTALRVDHPPVTDCFALRFDSPKVAVVFSADTCYFPPLAAFAKGADILVHEAMLGAGVDALVERMATARDLRAHLLASHTMIEDVGRIASEAGVGRLVLTHLVPADDPRFGQAEWEDAVAATWSGPVSVGRDGLEIGL